MVEMKIQLNQVRIYDPQSKYNNQVLDVLIENGHISQMAPQIKATDALQVNASELCVAPGFIDLKADFCDPGYEHKETIQNGLDIASLGGFTQVYIQPGTLPVMENKGQVTYAQQKAQGATTFLGVNGALTKGLNGEELAELYELYTHGVRLFTDDAHAVNAGILQRALLYTRDFGGRVSVFSRNAALGAKGQVNEGQASTRTGLKADPHLAEIIEVERNLRILAYTGGKLHLSGLSTAEAVNLVRKAKNEGLDVTSDVHLMNLCFTESAMLGFDTRYKVLPVLRTATDQKALWEGVIDGTIDAIVSDHRPGDLEEKDLEFDLAQFGAPQLETFFAALNTHKPTDLANILPALTTGPRKVLGIASTCIEPGAAAELTLFDPSMPYQANMQAEQLRFSPFNNTQLQGQIRGVIRGELASLVD
jgi:dihydroorotase